MTYRYAITWLKGKQSTKIAITGPQRSGTTIAAMALANDLNYKFFKEDSYGIGQWENFKKVCNADTNFVIHCPALMHKCLEMDNDIDIIVMRRPIEEIIRSQNQCYWVYEREERVKFFPFRQIVNCQQPISKIKYDFLEYLYKQNKLCGRIIELDYHSLHDHPLWIDRKNRTMAIRAHKDKPSDEVPINV